MRILVHDFGGYAFVLPLSRMLAKRGHTVLHAFCASLQTTPRGPLRSQPDDPAGFEVKGLALGAPLEKYNYVKRWQQENEYGRLAVREVETFRPDVVIAANMPLDSQRRLVRACRKRNIRFVFWLQDLIGIATHRLLRRKIPVLGEAVGRYYLRLEQSLLQQSDAVVMITEDFRSILHDYGLSDTRLHVIENWAQLEHIPLREKGNAWAKAHDLSDKFCFVYSGTLGMKHNPDLLLQLALQFRDQEEVRVVVVSQGLGAEWLVQKKEEQGLDNLLLWGFQPFEELPDMLATADVLVAVLEPEAGAFSVPSKVLTYLCAARPVLLAMPPNNLAARIVKRIDAGVVVSPSDTAVFLAAAKGLLDDGERRAQQGQHARRYAEQTFDIETITNAFERVLNVE